MCLETDTKEAMAYLTQKLARLENELKDRKDEQTRLASELRERDEREGRIWESLASQLSSGWVELAQLELDLQETRQSLREKQDGL